MSESNPTKQSRAVGTVLGAAIGDAIGKPTEFIGSFEEIRHRYPPAGVTGFAEYRTEGGRRFAPYTDDTQMAEVVLRTLLHAREGNFDVDATMEHMSAGFVEWSNHPQGGHRAPGNACLAGCRALEAGVHWSEAGGETAGGCGSVMRAYPFGLIFADDPTTAERWAVEHSKLTHRDPIAFAACAAMALAVGAAMRGEQVDSIQAALVEGAGRYSPETAAMIETAIDEAVRGVGPEVTLSRLQGWAAHEAISAGAYVFSRHPDDLRAAVLEGANTPGDSDSIATIAGALLGAHLGFDAIPSDWVTDVERSDELLQLAGKVG
jgi:ADP-ribosylglycohydrolase